MKVLFKFDGFTVKSKIINTGDNYSQMVYLLTNGVVIAGTSFKEHEPLANIMQWAINASKPNNFTL